MANPLHCIITLLVDRDWKSFPSQIPRLRPLHLEICRCLREFLSLLGSGYKHRINHLQQTTPWMMATGFFYASGVWGIGGTWGSTYFDRFLTLHYVRLLFPEIFSVILSLNPSWNPIRLTPRCWPVLWPLMLGYNYTPLHASNIKL